MIGEEVSYLYDFLSALFIAMLSKILMIFRITKKS